MAHDIVGSCIYAYQWWVARRSNNAVIAVSEYCYVCAIRAVFVYVYGSFVLPLTVLVRICEVKTCGVVTRHAKVAAYKPQWDFLPKDIFFGLRHSGSLRQYATYDLAKHCVGEKVLLKAEWAHE